jgi:hypothetical protein
MRITTFVSLPPGALEREQVAGVLEVALGSWIDPDRYGHIEAKEPLPAGAGRVPLLLDSYERDHDLVLAQRAGNVSLEIVPSRPGQPSFARYIAWEGPADAPWLARETQRDQAWRVMALVGSPLAVAAASEARKAFTMRTVPDAWGERLVPTVQNYTKGLEYPHWRMWFGPEYREFIGPGALEAAPAVARHDFGDGCFVELFEDPHAWDRPEGRAAAERFAAALGRRVFYDPDDPDAELEAPDFSHLQR